MNNITLDVGGTIIKYAVFRNDSLIFFAEAPSESSIGRDRLLYNIKSVIRSCLDRIDFTVDAIGISTTGQVDSLSGSILFANNTIPGYTGTNIKSILEKEFLLPVFVENDVNSAAIGEAIYGAGRNYNDFLMLTYGTGIGGAIIIDRKLYRGSNHAAAEFGHIKTHPGGLPCGCGARGCYEAYASTTALIRNASAVNPKFTDGRRLFDALNKNDTSVIPIINDWINEISYGLITLITVFNPSCIILGGGIMSQEYIHNRLTDLVIPGIPDSLRNLLICRAELDNMAGVYGIKAVCCGEW